MEFKNGLKPPEYGLGVPKCDECLTTNIHEKRYYFHCKPCSYDICPGCMYNRLNELKFFHFYYTKYNSDNEIKIIQFSTKEKQKAFDMYDQTTNFLSKMLIYGNDIIAQVGKGESKTRMLSKAVKDNNLKLNR